MPILCTQGSDYMSNILIIDRYGEVSQTFSCENSKNKYKHKFIIIPDDNKLMNNQVDYIIFLDYVENSFKIPQSTKKVIHLTAEPEYFKMYSQSFLNQFDYKIGGHIKSNSSNVYPTLPGLNWRVRPEPNKSLNDSFDRNKSKLISLVTSNRLISTSKEHQKRYEFCKKLKQHFGDQLDWYGLGVDFISNKLDGLKDYRFHIALENCYQENFFTEKLSDPFIANCYPIYSGCPNIENYFPKNALQTIDINDFDGSIHTIENAITQNYDIRYSKEIKLSKKLVMNDYNLFQIIAEFINKVENGQVEQIDKPQRIIPDIIFSKKDIARFDRGNKYKAMSKILPMHHIWNIERKYLRKNQLKADNAVN